jgi:hypothetical protein
MQLEAQASLQWYVETEVISRCRYPSPIDAIDCADAKKVLHSKALAYRRRGEKKAYSFFSFFELTMPAKEMIIAVST